MWWPRVCVNKEDLWVDNLSPGMFQHVEVRQRQQRGCENPGEARRKPRESTRDCLVEVLHLLSYKHEFQRNSSHCLSDHFLMCAESLQSRPTLSGHQCSPPVSSAHGTFQASILEWVAMPSSGGSSWLGDRTRLSHVFCIGWWVLYH